MRGYGFPHWHLASHYWIMSLTNSSPYSLWNHAPISFMFQCIASCGILLNFIFTWYSKKNCAWLSTITIGINLDHLHKKQQIDDRALALSSFPWFNTIHTSGTISITWGQNWGVTFPSPFINTILSAFKNWMKLDVPITWYPPSPT